MIERQGKMRIIMCDVCDQDFEPYRADEFGEMIAAAKADGWEIRPDGEGHFCHRCPSCQAQERPSERARRMLFG